MWEKYDRPVQAMDDNIIWHKLFACSLNRATNTHSEYVIHAKTTQWYLIPTYTRVGILILATLL